MFLLLRPFPIDIFTNYAFGHLFAGVWSHRPDEVHRRLPRFFGQVVGAAPKAVPPLPVPRVPVRRGVQDAQLKRALPPAAADVASQ